MTVVKFYGPLRLDPAWVRQFKRCLPDFAKWLRERQRRTASKR